MQPHHSSRNEPLNTTFCVKSKNNFLEWCIGARCNNELIQSSYSIKEWTGIPSSLPRPLSDFNSITTRHPSTIPPAFDTSSAAALSDPPVASKSSTIRIFWSFLIAPHWSSKTSVPYSRVYSTLCVSPGSFPFFLIGMHPMPSSAAIVKLNRKPRASRPTTASIDGWFFLMWFTRSSFRATHVGPSVKAVKMSLKWIEMLVLSSHRNQTADLLEVYASFGEIRKFADLWLHKLQTFFIVLWHFWNVFWCLFLCNLITGEISSINWVFLTINYNRNLRSSKSLTDYYVTNVLKHSYH